MPPPQPAKNERQRPPDPKTLEPSEESLGIRVVAFFMAVLCICVGVAFVNTDPYLALLYIIFAIGGSVLSFSYRHYKNNWQSKVVVAGIILVGINCWRELGASLEMGELSIYTPIVHFVAGTFVVQTFELRTRSDINMSQVVGLILLCIVAPIAKSILFGACILLYITLAAILFYYDSISRTAQGFIVKPIKEVRLEPTHLVKPRHIHGTPSFAIASLPLAAAILFFLLPRADGLIDSTTAYLRSLGSHNNEMVQMPPLSQDKKMTDWKPRDKKGSKSKNVLAKGKPVKPGAHDDDIRTSGGQKTGKPGKQDEPRRGKQEIDKEGKLKDEGERLPPDSKMPRSKESRGAKEQRSGEEGEAGPEEASGRGKKGQSSGGVNKSRATTSKEDLIAYDDGMSVQQELNGANELLIKVKSNRTAYLRMYSFDSFDGFFWKAADEDANIVEKPQRGDIKVSEEPSLQLPSNFPAVELVQDYSIEHDLSRNVPVAWVPKALSPNLNAVSVDDYGSIRLKDGDLKKGDQFKVVSSFPVYNIPAMEQEQLLTPGDEEQLRSRMSPYLQMPDLISEQVEQLAEKVTSPLPPNWFTRAEALTQYLRTHYRYSVPKHDRENPVEDFLFKDKSGDCKDFATALAMLTRSVGIPSRVVCGYAPGDFNAVSGCREIRSKHRHVWSEIYVPKYGWVPFDAQPNGYLPDKPREKSYDMVALQESMQGADLKRSESEAAGGQVHKRKVITPMDLIVWFVDAVAIGAIAYFVWQAIRNALAKRRDESARAHPAKKFLKKVETALKKWKVEKRPADTGTELGARVRNTVNDRRRLPFRIALKCRVWSRSSWTITTQLIMETRIASINSISFRTRL